MANVVLMPAVVADAVDAVLTSWLVEMGDQVTKGQALAEIETDKANVEVTAERAGKVGRLLAAAGDRVAVGAPICVLLAAGEDTSAIAAALGEAAERPVPVDVGEAAANATAGSPPAFGTAAAATGSTASARANGKRLFASPLARRLAAEYGLDLTGVQGRGPRGRVVRADVEAAVAVRNASRPAVAADEPTGQASAGFEDIEVPRMRQAIARRLTESKSTVPHFYVTCDVRMDALLAFRRQVNQISAVKVSINDLIIKAIGMALLAVPDANAIWNTTSIRRFTGVDVSVAVSTGTGLVTPVVRGVDRLPLPELAAVTADLIGRARAGRLKQSEIEGGSFSVSNMGMYGVREFSAILNPPQSGILAVGAAEQRPVVVDGALTVASVATLTLSCDHRVIDGALGAQLLQAIKASLEEPLRLVVGAGIRG